MRRVCVAAGSRVSAEAGAAVGDVGGNAVDAAMAAMLVAMCTEPGIIAPGGSGFITIWPAEGEPVVIDGYAEMPGRGLSPDRLGEGGKEVHIGYGGGMDTVVGWASVATPGAFAGFGEAERLFGQLAWAQILEPVIEIVDRGFPLPPVSAEYLGYTHELIFGWDPASHGALHHEDGTPLATGDIVHMPDLANSLRRMAAEGPESIYTGSLAEILAESSEAGGGILTQQDLASYQQIKRQPTRVQLDQWEIATNPPPAVGGVTLGAMLLLLDGYPFTEWSSDHLIQLARVQRAVLRYRSRALDDYGTRGEAAAALLEMAGHGDLSGILAAPSTAHISAVDTEGNACSITVSAGYGSGAIATGTGIWLNNSLGELELHPEGFHALEPGTRLVSNMAPTIARRADGAVLAIGTPGADRITTALASVLLNFAHLGMSLSDAVAHPRLHVETFAGKPTIAHEPGLDVEDVDDLEVRRFPDISMYFGGVQAALWDPAAGLFGAADPRRTGAVARGGVD